jgi:anti-sigma B factor antagonist
MSEQFRIEESEMHKPIAVLKISGRIGVKEAKELRTQCASLRRSAYQHLVLNMSGVTFIASSGIGALIVMSGEMRIKGGGVYLVSVSQPVLRVIKLLNVGGFLIIKPSEDEVLAGLKVNR